MPPGLFWLMVGLAATPAWFGVLILTVGVACTVAVWRLR